MEKDVISARKQIRKKKPKFIRQRGVSIKRLGTGWRKPKGIHSKIRLKRRGRPAGVRSGYRTPLLLRDLNPKGLIEVRISHKDELKSLDKSKHAVIIPRQFGLKKKLELAKEVAKAGITMANLDLKLLEDKVKANKDKAKKKKEAKKTKPKAEQSKKDEKKTEETTNKRPEVGRQSNSKDKKVEEKK